MALLTGCILIFPLIPNLRRLRGKHLQARFSARAQILIMCYSLTDLKGCHDAFVSSKVKRKNPSAVTTFAHLGNFYTKIFQARGKNKGSDTSALKVSH